MHTYLTSIGFGAIDKKKEMDEIIREVIDSYDEKIVAESRPGHLFAEFSKYYGCDCGITVCGEYDEKNEFQVEYYVPFFRGTGVTTQEKIIVERHAGKDSYAGACDDLRIGVTIIFYLQNAGEYLTEKDKGFTSEGDYPLTLTGLAKSGTILFPVKKDEVQVQHEKEISQNRNQLIAAARRGDEDAMENLTMEDIDIYTMISKRISSEDVLTIVDSYFMPYGIECDQYSVLGEIVDCHNFRNTKTGEAIYHLSIECNDLQFDVCVNRKDLLGEPAIGRRFKGVIWLQGQILF